MTDRKTFLVRQCRHCARSPFRGRFCGGCTTIDGLKLRSRRELAQILRRDRITVTALDIAFPALVVGTVACFIAGIWGDARWLLTGAVAFVAAAVAAGVQRVALRQHTENLKELRALDSDGWPLLEDR